jgi:hypothetical protein
MRIENLDWNRRVIFVPDSKTPTGRRFIPNSNECPSTRFTDGAMCRQAGLLSWGQNGLAFNTSGGQVSLVGNVCALT